MSSSETEFRLTLLSWMSDEFNAFPHSIQNAITSIWIENNKPGEMIVSIERWTDADGQPRFRVVNKKIIHQTAPEYALRDLIREKKCLIEEEKYLIFRKKMIKMALRLRTYTLYGFVLNTKMKRFDDVGNIVGLTSSPT